MPKLFGNINESFLTNGWFWIGLLVCAVLTAILFAKYKHLK